MADKYTVLEASTLNYYTIDAVDGFVGWFMVFNATFNNISAISWRSVILVEETGENHRPAVSH
jgi:hypothetical protein